jgi:NTP pyrophosphatase (non-canonical NTP hydrolase)
MSEFKDLTNRNLEFIAERDWKKFHTPKDMALGLSLEAAEVLEHFQWRDGKDLEDYIIQNKHDIGEELADVLNWVLLIAHDFNIDIYQAAKDKVEKNKLKYPVDKFKGSAGKHSDLAQ